MDLTIADIAAKLPADDSLKAWIEGWAELPADSTVAEFAAKFLQAAYRAQVEKNAIDPTATQITAYQEPTNGIVTLDVPTGIASYVATYSVNVRVPVDLNASIATLQ